MGIQSIAFPALAISSLMEKFGKTLRNSNANIRTRVQADAGPKQLGNSNGYNAYKLDLSACGLTLTGNYAIEFYTRSTTYDPNSTHAGFYLEFFDVTVANCNNQAVKGRLWSNNWCIAIKKRWRWSL